MTTKLSSSNYTALNSGITELMRAGTFSGVSIKVYSDEAGTVIVNGSDGTPINNLKISRVNTTNQYVDANGVTINATIIVGFANNADFISTDNVDNYWYTLEGIVLVKRTF